MAAYRYLRADVPEPLIGDARKQIQDACTPACLVMEVALAGGGFRFVIGAPEAEAARVAAAVSGLTGLALSQASQQDAQQLHRYAEGKIPETMDF